MSYPVYITSIAPEIRRNSNTAANPVRFKKTNSTFWNICKAAVHLPISNEALSFVTKWKFLFEKQDLYFSSVFILFLIKCEEHILDF